MTEEFKIGIEGQPSGFTQDIMIIAKKYFEKHGFSHEDLAAAFEGFASAHRAMAGENED